MVPCTKFEIPSKHDTASKFCFINYNIITRNYGLTKTTLILVVAFVLSVSIYLKPSVMHKSTVARTFICRQDGRG